MTGVPSWKIGLVWTLICLTLVLASLRVIDQKGFPLSLGKLSEQALVSRADELRTGVERVLIDYGINLKWVSGDNHSKKIRVPRDLPTIALYAGLMARLRDLEGHFLRAESNPTGDRMLLEVGLQKESLFQLSLVSDGKIERAAGKIALVLDDVGETLGSTVEGFLNLSQVVTVSVRPGLKDSERIAQAAVEQDLEVLIHVPIDTQNESDTGDFILGAHMSSSEVRARIRRMMRSLSQATGIDGHMGYLGQNEKLLSAMLDEVRKRRFLFLDSRPGRNKKVYMRAQEMKIAAGFSENFLDLTKDEAALHDELYLLADNAIRHGWAIGVCHPHKVTLKVLRRELPKLERKGFKFVKVSEITI